MKKTTYIFKRINAKKLAIETGLPYSIFEVLRQTAIEHLVEVTSKIEHWNIDTFKRYLLLKIVQQLDLMIVEKEIDD